MLVVLKKVKKDALIVIICAFNLICFRSNGMTFAEYINTFLESEADYKAFFCQSIIIILTKEHHCTAQQYYRSKQALESFAISYAQVSLWKRKDRSAADPHD